MGSDHVSKLVESHSMIFFALILLVLSPISQDFS